MSKFTNINYPFYGLKKPVDVVYNLDSIKTTAGLVVDDRSTKGSTYIQRVFNLPEPRLQYDFTAKNIENILASKIKWGIDNEGVIFDLSIKEKYKSRCVKISKIKNNLIWGYGISYPFNLPIIPNSIDKFLFVSLAFIDHRWRLYEINYKYNNKDTVRL